MRNTVWLLLVAALVIAGTVFLEDTAAVDGAWLDRASIRAERRDDGITVRCTINNPQSRRVSQPLEVWIADLEGSVLMRRWEQVTLSPGKNTARVDLLGVLPDERVPTCVLHYDFRAPMGRDAGARSLMAVMAQLESRLVAYRDLMAGSVGSLRLAALDHATQEPVAGADVAIRLVSEGRERPLLEGRTGADGSLDAQFRVPDDIEGKAELHITVAAGQLGEDSIVQPVTIKRKWKILLTTDKPLYQPGQCIQVRSLALAAADLKPASDASLVFEIMDPKGNKVFKQKAETDAFGIASTEFQLASEVNLGAYIVRAILGDVEAEKQVTVDRYVLPKFKIDVETDRAYYLPGETLEGDVQADYFFGKPVAGGKVEIVASKFEIEFTEFARIEGLLDSDGHMEFELPLPDYFAGTPIEQGGASVRLEAVVVDTADHREEKVVMKPVAEAPLNIFAVPESGALAPGLENEVYVLVSYPDGSPAAGARVRARAKGLNEAASDTRTDALGIATISLTPEGTDNVQLDVLVRDAQGREAEKRIDLSSKALAESLILRTDKALYEVGDTLDAQVFATKKSGTVYFDMVREGQTVMTRTSDLEDGRAAVVMDIDASLAGSIVLQAYVFTPGTDLVRDTRLLYVNPADALNLAVDLAADTYKPGETAQIQFAITDDAGRPTPAAIGIAIVDESVFALQEIHPGLEKVYFTLEKEIMKPRYEIHGYALDDLVKAPGPEPMMRWSEEQQEAARVLLASAPAPPEPPIKVNTFTQKQTAADEAIAARYMKDFERIQRIVNKYMERHDWKAPDDLLKTLLREKYLRDNELLDPWGNPYEFDFSQIERRYFTMTSYGPDEIEGTADDLSPETTWGRRMFRGGALGGRGGVRRMLLKADAMVEMPMAAAEAMPMFQNGVVETFAGAGMEQEAVPGAQPPRLREYFPETLLFEPALITDRRGLATLDVALADSITTWRMTAMASSRAGALGSKETPIRVFQDFFVDLDLPVALTQHDEVSIPVVAYNYLDAPQTVRLEFEEEPWFELDGDPEVVLELGPEEVRSIYFPIEVVELGRHRLTVYAYGTVMSDAIRREIEVLPDGEEQNVTYADRLSGRVKQAITIPANAVEGASKILVYIYPGVYSQIVDGLDSMLRMPNGCFEQTSSATYPNILVVQYMKATDQINPEIQMKAEGFINAGYQRLLAYEVDGGGFSWFGDAPANKVLTAWGLKEFFDMAQVHEVDPAVIDRTRAWLLARQEGNGSWKPDESYLHAESWGGIQNSDLLVTAYILDAVLSSGGQTTEGAEKAIDYLRANWKDTQEAYTLALVANALVSWNPRDAWPLEVLADLRDLCEEDDEAAHWKGGTGTVTFTHGDAADVETTALAAIAFLNAGKYPETTSKALTYLIRKKGAHGHWGSTQATILALKALMLSLGTRTEQVDATVTIALNGEEASRLRVTPENSDVMRLVDLGELTKSGANTVELNIQGEGSMLYQIVGRYYTPWAVKPKPEDLMTIDIAYDKRELAVDDLVTVTVKVKNNRRAAAQMIIVDLGIPPGFQVVTPDLEELVERGVLDKYELTGRQIITYFEKIDGNATIEFSYKLRAKFPLRAQTPSSRVYEYYNPEIANTAAPQEIVVL